MNFSIAHVNKLPKHRHNVTFCGEPKIMVYYHYGPNTVRRKTNEEKFGTFSVIVFGGCVFSKAVGELRLFNDVMTKECYIDILKQKLTRSADNFEFVDPSDSRKLNYKLY